MNTILADAIRNVSFSPSFCTCRCCKQHGTSAQMVKYGVRHYAHADCALAKWGAAFFDRLNHWQLGRFPAMAAHRAGLLEELGRRYDASRPQP